MGTKTTEEVKQEMIEKMGMEFGSLFYSLYNEITWLTFKWIEFRELYATKQSRIELMNKVAPFFFFTTQKVYWENLLLGIARITDPAMTGKKKNATLRALGEHISDDQFKHEYEKSITEILAEADFCRDWRNRWIAHIDYELSANKRTAEPLKIATREKLRLTIEKIQALYNKVSFKYLGSTIGWQLLSSNAGAISLLYRAEDGLRFDKEVYQRKLRGDWTNDDFQSLV